MGYEEDSEMDEVSEAELQKQFKLNK